MVELYRHKRTTWVIDWTKVQTVEDIKHLLQALDIEPIETHPQFGDIRHLCKQIDQDGKTIQD